MKKTAMIVMFSALFGATSAMAHSLEWDALMLAAVKLQPQFDYEANVDSYMQLYRSDVWKKYRNDEFELQDKREETIKMMKERVSSFPLDEEFVVYTTFNFSDYDFKKQMFPLDALSETTYFSDQKWSSGSFPRTYKVFFTNSAKIGDINMAKDDARNFLKARKDRYGNVNRRINAKLQFRVTKLKNGRNELEAQLTHAVIYSDDQRAKVLQEF